MDIEQLTKLLTQLAKETDNLTTGNKAFYKKICELAFYLEKLLDKNFHAIRLNEMQKEFERFYENQFKIIGENPKFMIIDNLN